MKLPIVRNLALLSITLVALSGCSNKKDQAKVKELESELTALQEESSSTLAEREKELSNKEEAYRTMQSETAEKIQQLTSERDTAISELDILKKEAARAEARRVASLPKDASSPGHADYNPAREPKITNAVCTITGDKSSGSGFVVAAEGKLYVYTAAHVISGNKSLSITNSAGTKFSKFGNLEVADGADFVRLELQDAADAPSLQLASAGTKVASDTDVSSLGASVSSGNVTGERGKTTGQTSDFIEVDPTVLQGKSGGPLLDTASGKIIAIIIAQPAERSDGKPAAAITNDSPCRAGRLNRAVVWKTMPVAAFLAEAKKITDFDRMTRVGQAISVLSPTVSGLSGLSTTVAGGQRAQVVLTEAKDIPIAVEVLNMHTQLAAKKAHTSDVDLKKRYASLVSSVLSQMQRGKLEFDPAKFSSYHRRFADASITARNDVEKQLKKSGD